MTTKSVIIKILSNLVNDAEVNTIFADLKKNPKYLYNAYQKLDHAFSGRYLSLFMSAILKKTGNRPMHRSKGFI